MMRIASGNKSAVIARPEEIGFSRQKGFIIGTKIETSLLF